MHVPGCRKPKHLVEDPLDAPVRHPPLHEKRSRLTVAFDDQGQRTERLRELQGVVPRAWDAMDEYRAGSRQSGGIGKRLIGEEQALFRPYLEGAQTKPARA
jgi:hypothetical protein